MSGYVLCAVCKANQASYNIDFDVYAPCAECIVRGWQLIKLDQEFAAYERPQPPTLHAIKSDGETLCCVKVGHNAQYSILNDDVTCHHFSKEGGYLCDTFAIGRGHTLAEDVTCLKCLKIEDAGTDLIRQPLG